MPFLEKSSGLHDDENAAKARMNCGIEEGCVLGQGSVVTLGTYVQHAVSKPSEPNWHWHSAVRDCQRNPLVQYSTV